MPWLIRFLFLINQDWFLAVIIAMAVMLFLPVKYRDMWVLGGVAAWIIIIRKLGLLVMAKVSRDEHSKVDEKPNQK